MKTLWRNIVLHSIILVGLLAFFYVFLLVAERNAVDEFTGRVDDKIRGIEEGIIVMEEITGGDGGMNMLREDVEMLKGRFVPYDLMEEVSWELAEWARKAGLTPMRVIPPIAREGEEIGNAEETQLSIEGLPIVLEMKGEYMAFGEFLQILDQFPYHVSVDELRILSEVPGKGPLSLRVEFKVFCINEKAVNET